MTIKVEKTAYAGWPNCYRLSNGVIDLIVTSDVGPRIIRFGFDGGENEFGEMKDQVGLTGGDEWRIYGGHRLWHSPEAKPRSYYPDNEPVQVEETEDGLSVLQPVEKTTGIQKSLQISMSPDSPRVEVIHRLENKGLWPVELAPWALSVMRTGGVCVVPQPQGDPEALLPNRSLTLWPYTDMSDARLTWGRKYIMLRQNPNVEPPCKFGLSASDAWVAYVNQGVAFVKLFDYYRDAIYPDNGCSVEVYTNDQFLEAETLGPLSYLEPGDMVEHTEVWHLTDGLDLTGQVPTEQEVDAQLVPKIEKWQDELL